MLRRDYQLPRHYGLIGLGMAHRGRFLITQLANTDVPADLSFKREHQHSPKTLLDKSGVNHEQESNKPDASPRSAVRSSLAHQRNSSRTLDTPQYQTPVFPASSPPHPHAGPDSQPDHHSLVPVSVISLLQESLCGRFTEMMQLHKEVMEEMSARDRRRDEQMGLLIGQNMELVRTVARLRYEQAHIREPRRT